MTSVKLRRVLRLRYLCEHVRGLCEIFSCRKAEPSAGGRLNGRAFRRPAVSCGLPWSAPLMLSQIGCRAIYTPAFLKTQPAPHFAGMPRRSVLCLVCWSRKWFPWRRWEGRRRRCQLCLRHRALPSCRPEHCWIVEARSCRDCLERFLHRAADQAAGMRLGEDPSRIILSFLQEEDWW